MKKIACMLLVLIMVLSLSACGGGSSKYQDIIDMLDNKDYAGAINVISQMAMAEQMAGQEQTPVVEILASTWTTNAEKGPREMTFTTDGNLTVDGKAMTWSTDKGEFDVEMRLQIFEDGIHRYLAFFNASDRYAVPFVELYYMEEVDGHMECGEYIGKYYNHPMITLLMSSWSPVSSYEKVVDGFWLSSGDASINGESYDWEVTDDSSEDQLVVHASGKNDVTGEYTMTVSMRGDYPVLTLTDDATGASGLYYNGNYGEDETWAENRYANAMNWLNEYEQYGYFWTNDTNYEDEAAINFLQAEFEACDGYKDSAERLANWDSVWFTRANRYLQRYLENGYFYADPEDTYYNDYSGAVEFLHGLFTDISDYSEAATVLENWNDVLLNRANRILEEYLSRSDGQLHIDGKWQSANASRAYVYAQFAQIQDSADAAAVLDNFTIVPQAYIGAKYATVDNMGNEGNGTWESFRYNDKGQMIYADAWHNAVFDDLFETYGAREDLNFFYDDAGVMNEIKISYNLESSVTAVLTPSYDEKGNLVAISATYNDGTRNYTFTYDEAGRRTTAHLDKNVNGETSSWSIYDYTYTYDAAGRLIQKEYVNNSTIQTTTYTYDANGYLIQESMVENYHYSYSGTKEYRYTKTMTYTYDAQGRPVTAEYTSDQSNFNYKSYTITYNYEDLYFYNAD